MLKHPLVSLAGSLAYFTNCTLS